VKLAVPREQLIDFVSGVVTISDDLFAHRAGGAEKSFELNRWQSLYFRL